MTISINRVSSAAVNLPTTRMNTAAKPADGVDGVIEYIPLIPDLSPAVNRGLSRLVGNVPQGQIREITPNPGGNPQNGLRTYQVGDFTVYSYPKQVTLPPGDFRNGGLYINNGGQKSIVLQDGTTFGRIVANKKP